MISCIIPCYNEEERVKNVINVVTSHELISEVIVVDDGSDEKTKSILRSLKHEKLKVLFLNKNMGKAYAVYHGTKNAKNDLVLLLDADLINLKKEHIDSLIAPIINKEAHVSMSLRKNALLINKIFRIDPVSGERCLKKDILLALDNLENLRFGLETKINLHILKNNLKYKIVKIDAISPRKKIKHGFLRGSLNDIKMIYEIIRKVGFKGFLKGYFIMLIKHKIKTKN